MDLTKLTQNEEILIAVTTKFDVDSSVKGYHEYKSIWTPKIGEILLTEREPGNLVDKYVVCVKKENELVGHLPLGKDRKFAKTVLFFESRLIWWDESFMYMELCWPKEVYLYFSEDIKVLENKLLIST